jgi:hypothetical protein
MKTEFAHLFDELIAEDRLKTASRIDFTAGKNSRSPGQGAGDPASWLSGNGQPYRF